jgi:hypothetical protein
MVQLQVAMGRDVRVNYLKAVGGKQDAPNGNPGVDRSLHDEHQVGRPLGSYRKLNKQSNTQMMLIE